MIYLPSWLFSRVNVQGWLLTGKVLTSIKSLYKQNKDAKIETSFCCRFICSEDREWFEKGVSRVIQEHVEPSLVPKLHPEPYFVDFLRDAPEPTGEEGEDACFDAPKIYELVKDLYL